MGETARVVMNLSRVMMAISWSGVTRALPGPPSAWYLETGSENKTELRDSPLVDLHTADVGLGPGLLSLGNIQLGQPQLNVSAPPVSLVEAVCGSEDVFPGDENSATDIDSPSVDQRNHPGKIALLSPPPTQDVQLEG